MKLEDTSLVKQKERLVTLWSDGKKAFRLSVNSVMFVGDLFKIPVNRPPFGRPDKGFSVVFTPINGPTKI